MQKTLLEKLCWQLPGGADRWLSRPELVHVIGEAGTTLQGTGVIHRWAGAQREWVTSAGMRAEAGSVCLGRAAGNTSGEQATVALE